MYYFISPNIYLDKYIGSKIPETETTNVNDSYFTKNGITYFIEDFVITGIIISAK